MSLFIFTLLNPSLSLSALSSLPCLIQPEAREMLRVSLAVHELY